MSRPQEGAVIGHPIGHTLSPAIFHFLSQNQQQQNFRYGALNVEPAELKNFLMTFREQSSWVGLNVTIPHKESIGSLLDRLSPEAQAVGAVNVVARKDKVLTGHNTDVAGVLATLQAHYSGPKKCALIFGAGGAARAAAFALGQLGFAQVSVHNRSAERAQKLCSDFSKLFAATTFEVGVPQNEVDLVINSTPVGMSGVGGESLIFASFPPKIAKSALAFDMVYQPAHTPFLAKASGLGLACVGGLEMLVQQALATWQIWFGTSQQAQARPLLTELQKLLPLRARPLTKSPQRVFLTGFMGAGKSEIGALLSHRIGWAYVDTDQLIERESGLAVSELFAQKGEKEFRRIETHAIANVCQQPRLVVSLGGGAILDDASRALLQKSGVLIYLEASPATLEQRLRDEASHRPLLADCKNPAERLQRITALLNARKPAYESAEVRILTDDLSPTEIVERIESEVFGLEAVA